MSKERPQPRPTPDAFGLTENEKLFDRISDGRFLSLFQDEATTVHRVELSSNSFGEFLFVTLSRSSDQTREYLTFWGKGFHEYRERWLTDEWFWYKPHLTEELQEKHLNRQEADELFQQHQETIAAYVTEGTQSERGRLFDLLADLTDEDGAWSELDDLGNLFDSY